MTWEVTALLDSAPWTFAKTMPEAPHWYTLRRNWRDQVALAGVVDFIRANGVHEVHGGRPYTYWYANGCKFWTMGAPVEQTILINRARARYECEYDSVAMTYDTLFRDAESEAENRAVFEMMLDVRGRVLDIGCGSGLLLDYCTPDAYVGVDPSAYMLMLLRSKHPDVRMELYNCTFEDYYGRGFDTIVALFGAASYIRPSSLARVREMLAPGGKAYLMHYKPGYKPVTHIECGISPRVLPFEGDGTVFNNYLIRTYENL